MFGKDSQLTFIIVLLVVFGIGVLYYFLSTQGIDINKLSVVKPQPQEPAIIYPENMKITSAAFEHEGKILEKYTCKGEDISPPLSFSEIPGDAKSLVLIVDDPDAPYKTWTHWIVFNIDPSIREVAENDTPPNSVLGENDFGKGQYGGPCPPVGEHRYFFKLYALDTVLEIKEGSSKSQVEEAMKGHILDKAELVGVFEK